MSEAHAAMQDARGRVAEAIEALLPRDPTAGDLSHLHLGGLSTQYAERLRGPRLEALYIGPIREIVERGGKCWRSLLLEACCRAVGGDFGPYELLLALPELIHVGSLIVDDVQDESDVRRGGPTCHLRHGTALAVNAGTGAYFLAERALSSVPLEGARRDAIRSLMFDAFRAAHAGQALDIGGFDGLVGQVLSGEVAAHKLAEQVELVHWLKTALPAAAFARVGCLLGDSEGEAADGVAAYIEALGMGFQGIDDVLNLRGFPGHLKTRGEDLTQGKLTLPVALALDRMPLSEGRALWARISACPQDVAEISSLTEVLEACGALGEVERRAYARADVAWAAVEPQLADAGSAGLLHSLGHALLRRQY